MCETSVTLGNTMTSSCEPAVETTSITSEYVQGVVQSLTRTPSSWSDHPGSDSAIAAWVRACAFASTATASSRSRNTAAAGSAWAFAIIFGLLAGTDKQVRRGRYADPESSVMELLLPLLS